MSLFCGKLADAADKLGLTAFERGFAEDNRFTFNFTKRQRQVISGLIAKYGKRIGFEL